MKKIILLKGLPASGKSTYAKKQCNAETVRVNKDDIRAMMGGEFSKGKENITLYVRDSLVHAALEGNKTVIVDDTNFAPQHEQTMRDLAALLGAEVEVKFFDTPVAECIKRDAARPNPVGKAVIMDMYRKYLKPLPEPVQHNPELPTCIIVDIDGTLAHMTGRSPYDYTRVHADVVDEKIQWLANNVARDAMAKMIVLSGRKDDCRDETLKWLMENNIHFNHLLMRKSGDDRPDWIVKKEIYERYIKGKYNVLFVIDDRDQVVTMWRDEGLKCLQVAEGNF